MNQEGVDAGAPRRPERILQDLPRLFEIDIAHHIERAVEIAVADGGDDDVADPAMIDAGNLLRGLLVHGGDLAVIEDGRVQVRRRPISGTRRYNRQPDPAFAPPCSGRCGLRHSVRRGWIWRSLPL